METKIMRVTPAMAERWLTKNEHNRQVVDAKVREYANAMQRGEWQLTHQGIAFDADGNVLDGQHRLWAILESGCTVKLAVSTKLESSVKHVIDTGRKRVASDVLYMQGEKDSIVLAAALRTLHAYHVGGARPTKASISHAQVLELLELNPQLRDVTQDGRNVAKALNMSPSIATAGAYLVHTDPEYRAWHDGLVHGVGLWEGDPRRALQVVLTNALRLRRKRPSDWQLALYGKAWLAFKAHKRLRQLMWRDDEPMPVFGHVKHWAPFRGAQ